MSFTDHNGLTWQRSADLLSITCEDGRTVYGNADMSDAYLVSVAYASDAPIKSDAERIAELEAQVQQLLSKLSNP